jgi:hypothetical protein
VGFSNVTLQLSSVVFWTLNEDQTEYMVYRKYDNSSLMHIVTLHNPLREIRLSLRICYQSLLSVITVTDWIKPIAIFVSSIHSVKKKCTSKPAECESAPQYKKKCFMNTGLLKHSFRVMTSGRLTKMLKVSTLQFKTGVARVKSEWQPHSVENSNCRVNDLKCIQYSLLHVLDVIEFCSINNRL